MTAPLHVAPQISGGDIRNFMQRSRFSDVGEAADEAAELQDEDIVNDVARTPLRQASHPRSRHRSRSRSPTINPPRYSEPPTQPPSSTARRVRSVPRRDTQNRHSAPADSVDADRAPYLDVRRAVSETADPTADWIPNFGSLEDYNKWTEHGKKTVTERAQIANDMINTANDNIRRFKEKQTRRRKLIATGEIDPDAEEEVVDVPPALSVGLKRNQEVLRPTYTDDDHAHQLKKDEDMFAWRRRPLPGRLALERALGGGSTSKRDCFACRGGGPSVSNIHMTNLANEFGAKYYNMDHAELACELIAYFEENIRGPTNERSAALRGKFGPGLQHEIDQLKDIPVWTPANLWAHFTKHVHDPDTILARTIDKLEDACETLETEGFYSENVRDPTLRRFCKDEFQMWMQAQRQLVNFSRLKPIDMMGYAGEARGIRFEKTAPFNQRKRVDPGAISQPLMIESFFGTRVRMGDGTS